MKNSEIKTIVFFDFDGTISNKDSFLDFITLTNQYHVLLFAFIRLMPYILKLNSRDDVKERLFSFLYKGKSVAEIKNQGKNYSLTKLEKIIRHDANKRIKWHVNEGHTVCVVTASSSLWLGAWCAKMKIDLIATEFEEINDFYSGKYSGKNCKGIEKVNRIKEIYDLNTYTEIYAYGDSKGDLQMLAISNKPFYRYF